MKATIHIAGLGAGDLDQLPLGIYKMLKQSKEVYVRTSDHPAIRELTEEGIVFSSFDDVYEAHSRFEKVYEEIAGRLIEAARKKGTLVYAVPGHPMVAEATVQSLLQQETEVEVTVHGGQSFLDAMFTALQIDPVDGFQLVNGLTVTQASLALTQHIIIGQVYDQLSASAVKLTLMDRLPDDYMVTVVTAAGTSEEAVVSVPLYELDRTVTLSNLTAVYVPPVKEDALLYRDFSMLRAVIRQLRGPDGCPWDKKQTHESLKRYLVEETYEVLEAIDREDDDHLAEELGDVLLQILLHAQIGEDNGFFNMEDVIGHLTEKMIRRHPHVFGDSKAENAEAVVENWEEIKQQEKKDKGSDVPSFTSLLDSIPPSLPALLQAWKMQKKAAKTGFDWGEEAPMWMKLQEELAEWLQALKEGNEEMAVEELGDVFFVLVNLARFHKIDPEEALRRTNRKFARRFRFIESALFAEGKVPEEQSLEELDALWEQAKKQERQGG